MYGRVLMRDDCTMLTETAVDVRGVCVIRWRMLFYLYEAFARHPHHWLQRVINIGPVVPPPFLFLTKYTEWGTPDYGVACKFPSGSVQSQATKWFFVHVLSISDNRTVWPVWICRARPGAWLTGADGRAAWQLVKLPVDVGHMKENIL